MTPDELRETAENYRRGELTPLCEILPAVMDGLAAVMDRIENVNSELETVRDRKTPLPSMTTDGEGRKLYRVALGDSRNTIGGGVLGYENILASCAEEARLIVERRRVPYRTVQAVERVRERREDAPVYGAADDVDDHLRTMKARRQFGGGIGVEK
jgi:hypothetical protein